MPIDRVRADPTNAELVAGFARIRAELGVPEHFPDPVDAEAARVAGQPGAAPAAEPPADHTHLELVTIDPAGSKDLDQALGAERRGDGYRVWYAIADVARFVAPGGALDRESRARGVTLYSPDERSPLYPDVLGEGAASLLPGEPRPALLWCIDLDGRGVALDSSLRRAVVRSRQALSYPDAQSALDGASPPLVLALLREVGERRQQRERERGGVNLDLPDQEVDAVDGGYQLAYRTPLPVEGWNAQISLLAGMEAARLMVAAGVGVLRTLPPPDDHTLKAIRRSAQALGHPWPDGRSWPEFLRSVDRSSGSGAALLTQAARAFRGAGYVTFTAGAPAGPAGLHAGVAAAYAHVTAPLRRLGDRVANEIVVALCAGIEPPGWAVQALDELPLVMDHASQRDNTLHRAIIDYVEAMVLRSRVGDTFDVTVTNIDHRGAVVQLSDPAVLARLPADGLRLGEEVTVRLVAADPATRRLEFALVR